MNCSQCQKRMKQEIAPRSPKLPPATKVTKQLATNWTCVCGNWALGSLIPNPAHPDYKPPKRKEPSDA